MYKMKNIISIIALTLFIILAIASDDSGSSSSSSSYGGSSSGSSYKSSSKTCQTCGYEYYSLPYKGQYCSSSCCKVWSELGDPGCGSW